jgi:hypothetical protein
MSFSPSKYPKNIRLNKNEWEPFAPHDHPGSMWGFYAKKVIK